MSTSVKPQSTPGLPAGTEAFCFICRQAFSSILTYTHHRDMELPAALRTCRVQKPKAR